MAKKAEMDALDLASRTAAATAREVQRSMQRPEEENEEPENQGQQSRADLAQIPRNAKNGDGEHDIDAVMGKIPEEERARIKFAFVVKRPNGLLNGNPARQNCGEYNAVGDDWPNQIKETLARTKGPGIYEGRAKHANGNLAKTVPWVFEITEDQAYDAGWAPPVEEEKVDPTTAPVGAVKTKALVTSPQLPAAQVAPVDPVAQAADPVAAAKKTLETLKVEVEIAKVKKDLADVTEKGAKKEAEPEEKNNPKLVDQIIQAEKARIEAERKAELAKAQADHEANLAKIKAQHEKDLAQMKSDRADDQRRFDEEKRRFDEDKRRNESALESLKSELQRQKDDLDRKLDNIERTKAAAPVPEKTDYVAIASAVAQALGAVVQPVTNILAAKLDQKPTPGPDMTKMFDSMANAIKSAMPAPVTPPPTPDPIKMLEKAVDLVTSKMQAAQPEPTPPPPPVDHLALLDKAVSIVKSAQPPAPPPPPPTPAPTPLDPFAFTNQVWAMAEKFAELRAPASAAHQRDEDDEEEHGPNDTLDGMLAGKEKLNKLGIDVQIGNTPPASAQQKSIVRDVIEGMKEALPAVGEAVARSGYFQSKVQQIQAQNEANQAKLRENAAAKKLQEQQRIEARRRYVNNQNRMRARLAAAGQAPQPQYAPQYVQQPPVAYPQQPQAPFPQVPAPVQAHAPQPQPQPRPAPRAALPPGVNPSAPTSAAPFGLPTVVMQAKPMPAPAVYPVETVPQRPQAPRPFVPVENLPTGAPQPRQAIPQRALTPQEFAAQQQALQARRAAYAARMQRPGQPVSRPAQAQPQAAPAPAPVAQAPAPQVPVQAPAPQAVQQPVAPQPVAPQPQPVAPPAAPVAPVAAPVAVQTPEPASAVLEALDQGGTPTPKTWGAVCDYAVTAAKAQRDPKKTAAYLLQRFPQSVAMIMGNCGTSVEVLEAGLTLMAGQVGSYGTVVSDLASQIRKDPGKTWASNLLLALNGGK